MRCRSSFQSLSLSEPCMTVSRSLVAALHRTILACGAASVCEVAHASNHGTDGSGPVQAGTILAAARAADFIPPFAGLHEFRAQAVSRPRALQRMIALYANYNYNSAVPRYRGVAQPTGAARLAEFSSFPAISD
jgi:hypothetical protein